MFDFMEKKNIESLLNSNEISHFEVTKHMFIVHMKNGDTVEVSADEDQLNVVHYRFDE